MERLTNSNKEIPTLVDNAEYWLEVYFKLKDYENLEEQDSLVILPCKYVYYIVDINNNNRWIAKRFIKVLSICEIENIDKENCKYFSTKEKAEAKLKELRGEEDESSN